MTCYELKKSLEIMHNPNLLSGPKNLRNRVYEDNLDKSPVYDFDGEV